MNNSHRKKHLNLVKDLLSSRNFAVLATESDHHPYTNLISFVPSDDFLHLYFPTRKATQKFLNITKNPHVALLIDDRKNSPEDLLNAITIIALGDAQELVEHSKVIETLFIQRHPGLSTFLSDPCCVLVDVSVKAYQIVQHFEEVQILQMRQDKKSV